MKLHVEKIIPLPVELVWEYFNDGEYEKWFPDLYITRKILDSEKIANMKELKGKSFMMRIENDVYLKLKSGLFIPIHSGFVPVSNIEISFKKIKESATQIIVEIKPLTTGTSVKEFTLPPIILFRDILETFKDESYLSGTATGSGSGSGVNTESISNSVSSFLKSLVGGLPRLSYVLLTGVVMTLLAQAIPFSDFGVPELDVEYYFPQGNATSDFRGVLVVLNPTTKDISGISEVDCDRDLKSRMGVGKTLVECWAIDNSPNKNEIRETIEIHIEEPSIEHWPQCINTYLVNPENTPFDHLFNDLHLQQSWYFEDMKKQFRQISYDEYNDKNYEQSIEYSSVILSSLDPSDANALSLLGVAIRDHDRTDKQRLDCSIQIHSMPIVQEKTFGVMALAEDYFVESAFEKTIDIISSVIDGYGSNLEIEEIHLVNSLIIRGNAHLRMESLDDAEQDYKTSIEIGGEKADSLFGLGIVTIFRDQDHDKAIEFFNDALDYDPTHAESLSWMIKSLNEKQDYEKIKVLLRNLNDTDPELARQITEKNPEIYEELL